MTTAVSTDYVTAIAGVTAIAPHERGKTSLMRHEIAKMSTAMVLDGLDLGLVKRTSLGFELVERHCTDCPAELPVLVCWWQGQTPKFDTFPRCSTHAF